MLRRRPPLPIALAGLALLAAGCAAPPRLAVPPVERMLVGEVAVERGEYAVAAREYRLAAAASRDPAVAERAARIAFDHGQDRALERIAREWLGRDAKSETARRFLAVALLQLDRRAEATAEFRQLVRDAYPTPAEAFAALTESLADLRNDVGAARTVAALAAEYPGLPEADYATASLALAASDSPAALAAVARALAHRPEWREARWLEARARVAGGDCPRGLQQAATLAAESSDGDRLLYAWLLTACERGAEARPYFEDLARGPARAEALEALAGLAVDDHHWDEATRLYTELLATGRNVDHAFYGLGVVAERSGEIDRAIRLYGRVGSGPRAPAAQLRAYRLALSHGDPDGAARRLDDYVAGTPEQRVAVTAGRAEVLADSGRGAEALALIDRALGVYPDREELHYTRATLLEKTGAVDAALSELRAMLKRRPLDPTAENALGFTLADHGRNLGEAEALVRAALADRPDSAAIRDSLGWVLVRGGHPLEGLDWLRRAYASDADPEIASHIGEAEWLAGDPVAAERTWRDALVKNPDDRHLKDALGRHLGPAP